MVNWAQNEASPRDGHRRTSARWTRKSLAKCSPKSTRRQDYTDLFGPFCFLILRQAGKFPVLSVFTGVGGLELGLAERGPHAAMLQNQLEFA